MTSSLSCQVPRRKTLRLITPSQLVTIAARAVAEMDTFGQLAVGVPIRHPSWGLPNMIPVRLPLPYRRWPCPIAASCRSRPGPDGIVLSPINVSWHRSVSFRGSQLILAGSSAAPRADAVIDLPGGYEEMQQAAEAAQMGWRFAFTPPLLPSLRRPRSHFSRHTGGGGVFFERGCINHREPFWHDQRPTLSLTSELIHYHYRQVSILRQVFEIKLRRESETLRNPRRLIPGGGKNYFLIEVPLLKAPFFYFASGFQLN